jgi:hypothetical protein
LKQFNQATKNWSKDGGGLFEVKILGCESPKNQNFCHQNQVFPAWKISSTPRRNSMRDEQPPKFLNYASIITSKQRTFKISARGQSINKLSK